MISWHCSRWILFHLSCDPILLWQAFQSQRYQFVFHTSSCPTYHLVDHLRPFKNCWVDRSWTSPPASYLLMPSLTIKHLKVEILGRRSTRLTDPWLHNLPLTVTPVLLFCEVWASLKVKECLTSCPVHCWLSHWASSHQYGQGRTQLPHHLTTCSRADEAVATAATAGGPLSHFEPRNSLLPELPYGTPPATIKFSRR